MRISPRSDPRLPPPSNRPRTLSTLPALPAPLLIRACSVRLQDSTRSARPRCATWRARAAREPSATIATAARASRAAAAAASRRGVHWPPHPPYGGPWRPATTVGCRGLGRASCAWQAVDASTLWTLWTWRQARGRRALRWRHPRRRRRARRCGRVATACALGVVMCQKYVSLGALRTRSPRVSRACIE